MSNKKTEKLLELADKRLKRAVESDKHNRKEAIEDLEFSNNEQWTQDEKNRRKNSGRPYLTVNLLNKFCEQVIGDQRQNKLGIKTRPVDTKADHHIAKIYDGLIKTIEYNSNFETIIDQSFEQVIKSGYGAWRILTQYTEENAFEQEIYIERIKNPFAVYIDPDAKDVNGMDAKYGFILERISRDEFKERYPDKTPPDDTIKSVDGMKYEHWYDKDNVTIAEYFIAETETKTMNQMKDGSITEAKEGQEYIDVIKSRKVEVNKIKRYVITSSDILEESDWSGRFIPIVLLTGKEVNIEGKKHIRGLIRYAKDPQRMFNYWNTLIAETIALAPKAPYIGTSKMFENFEEDWASSNQENYPFLKYNPDPDAPNMLPSRTQMTVPVGILTEAQRAAENVKDTMGIFAAGLGEASRDQSGKAILMRQREGDVSTFSFIDNLKRSVQHTGRILVDLIPKIYDTERDIRLRNFDDTESFVPINTTIGKAIQTVSSNPIKYSGMPMERLKTALSSSGNINTPFNDISVGKYDVVVEAGPSYSTQRIESAENLIKLVQVMPELAKIAPDLIIKNLDFLDSEELRRRIRKVLPPGLIPPQEGEDPKPLPPNPMMVAKVKELQTKALKNEADAMAKIASAKSEGQDLQKMIRQMVLNTMSEIFGQPAQPGQD